LTTVLSIEALGPRFSKGKENLLIQAFVAILAKLLGFFAKVFFCRGRGVRIEIVEPTGKFWIFISNPKSAIKDPAFISDLGISEKCHLSIFLDIYSK
jgi:hypothetical protein